MQTWRQKLAIGLLCLGGFSGSHGAAQENPFPTWNLLGPQWEGNDPLEFMTIEWEYYMIHDYSGKFNGVIGYVMTNPKGKGGSIGKVMPRGGNIAVSAQFNGEKAVNEYINFGLEGTRTNTQNRDTFLNDRSKGYWASLEGGETPSLAPSMHLQGRTELFAWDLIVTHQSTEVMALAHEGHGAFLPVTDKTKVGSLPGEQWTVDGIWPKTQVVGTITQLATGEVTAVNGKGYRENSWGRYAMPLDGWDFLVFSEYADDGVIAIVQTYHKSDVLDYMDVSFRDNGELKLQRFEGLTKAFKWQHSAWNFDTTAKQCVPKDWEILAENADYRVEMRADIDPFSQEAFISKETIGTRIFFIHEQFPKVKGKIVRKSDNTVVKEFEGQAGGEFAVHKSPFRDISDEACLKWGRRFSN